MIDLRQGDCLEVMKSIPDGSVDLILTDPPYGTMNTDGGRKLGINGWDSALDKEQMWHEINRVLRVNGACLLFAQQPYTTALINECHNNTPFSYCLTWVKDSFANALGCNKAPVNYTEDICVFFKKHDFLALHPLRLYFKEILDFVGLKLPQINKKLGHRRAEHSFYVTPKKAVLGEVGGKADHVTRVGSSQFSLCTEQTYNDLIDIFGIDEMQGFRVYSELKKDDDAHKKSIARAFNLHDGKKYKSNILEYKKDYNGYHPTQKPVLLLEDLIKTYSNEGNTVLDFTCGSGSTGVACVNTNRKFIGIELDKDYFAIAEQRIDTAVAQPDLLQGLIQ